jgi:hypothetical protein
MSTIDEKVKHESAEFTRLMDLAVIIYCLDDKWVKLNKVDKYWNKRKNK